MVRKYRICPFGENSFKVQSTLDKGFNCSWFDETRVDVFGRIPAVFLSEKEAEKFIDKRLAYFLRQEQKRKREETHAKKYPPREYPDTNNNLRH